MPSSEPRALGPDDEPQDNGALVVVHYGDYRRQEVWVRSGANIGNWYPLGNEFWAHPIGMAAAQRGIPQHPLWADVLARGPVTLLVPAAQDAYRAGWEAGRRRLAEQVESLADDGPDGT